MNRSFNLTKYTYTDEGASYRVILGQTRDGLTKVMSIPKRWIEGDIVTFPTDKSRLLLRYEFFYRGKNRLKKEEEITPKDFPRIL